MSQTFRGARLQIPGECPGEVIHVSKRAYEGIMRNRKIDVISIRSVGRSLVIDYVSKRGFGKGCMELNDIGPMPDKKKRGNETNG
ncbi:MAG: hypothetical protein P4L59_18875 [Desulfosporosinus sp.]|nr:hypothetical protein [Desulfosporosinus sp.]